MPLWASRGRGVLGIVGIVRRLVVVVAVEVGRGWRGVELRDDDDD